MIPDLNSKSRRKEKNCNKGLMEKLVKFTTYKDKIIIIDFSHFDNCALWLYNWMSLHAEI